MSLDAIVAAAPLGELHWPTLDPFLFCAFHEDKYPEGDERMGPKASLAGRNLGMDFAPRDGWRMYHGDVVPGFPRHPHRGFETVTIGRDGFVDHSDSLGATARFGKGDVQWMTAGKGIVHAEMFPLTQQKAKNPTGLFQIWLNLPASDKMVDPYFTMLWREKIPDVAVEDGKGGITQLKIYAGAYREHLPPPPPPNSWASRKESGLAIWNLYVGQGAHFTLPKVDGDVIRTLYVVGGKGLTIAGQAIEPMHAVQLAGGVEVPLVGGDAETELLLLQGRPIGEPVAKQGPFVMNTRAEIQQAMNDYRRTQFGGWPWKKDGPVHSRDQDRFAIHADGRRDEP